MAAADLFRIDGRVALVTGAGRGIGAEIALQLARAGAELVLVSRTGSELRQVAERIEAEGGRARVEVCDVRDSARVRALIAGLPQLDIVVNNAGDDRAEPFVDIGEAQLDALIELNTRSVFVVAQAAVRRILEAPRPAGIGGGCVINLSSQLGHVGAAERTLGCMTKHAVEGLTRSMAVELAAHGIRVNSIGPTAVDTALGRRVAAMSERARAALSQIPLGRLASATEVAAAAVFLASPAAAMVTGTCLRLDGGWTAQ